MSKQGLDSLLNKLPSVPGVYKMKDQEGRILYVGKAKNLNNRVRSYFQKSRKQPVRTQKLVERIADIEWIEVGSDLEAYVLETNLIKEFRPKYNVLMKDDKNFVYIKITKDEDYPRIKIVRRREKDGSRYFGPKTSAGQVKKTLALLQKLFMYRSCDLGIDWKAGKVKITKKTIAYPCLDYHIKRCAGPCIAEISPEEYAESIEQIERFLEGKTGEIEDYLKSQMQTCVAEKKFEKAAQLRDKLLAIENLQLKQIVSAPTHEEMDIFAFVLESGKAYFNLFQVRDGKLVNQDNFIAEASSYESGDEDDAPEILESFLHQYYEKASHIPPEVLIPVELEEDNFLEGWLDAQRGTRVHVKAPQRGKKNQLIELAKKNAESFLKQHRARWAGFGEEEQNGIEELQAALELEKLPKRIECFDISHLGGTDTVASMVVFENGRPKKSDYRKFRIKTLEEGKVDDFASMREILGRRLRYLSRGPAGVKFRKASKSSVKHIAALRKEWHGDEEVRGKIEEHYLAYHEKAPIGLIRMSKGANDTYLLRSLFVSEEWRGKSVATFLTRYAAEKTKAKRVYLSCFEDLLPFYEQLGFQQVKQIPKAFTKLYLDEVKKKHPDEKIYFLALNPKKQKDESFGSKPKLIVIDGGKGQVNAAAEVRDELGLNIPMVGLAKREEEIFWPQKSLPVLLPEDSAGLKLLQRLRNEAHRFAISFQKKSRKASITNSELDKIEGLGEKTKMKLLKHFGSLERIKKASFEDLSAQVGEDLAKKIQKV